MTTSQVVKTSTTVNNSPIQDYIHPNDYTQPTYEMTSGFKCFTVLQSMKTKRVKNQGSTMKCNSFYVHVSNLKSIQVLCALSSSILPLL